MLALFPACVILFPVMRDSYKDYYNEVTKHCNYWELGFGDIDKDYEGEVIRWAYENKLDVDAACDAWHEAINEHMWEKVL